MTTYGNGKMTARTASCGCSSKSKCDFHRGFESGREHGLQEAVLSEAEKFLVQGVLFGFTIAILACVLVYKMIIV